MGMGILLQRMRMMDKNVLHNGNDGENTNAFLQLMIVLQSLLR